MVNREVGFALRNRHGLPGLSGPSTASNSDIAPAWELGHSSPSNHVNRINLYGVLLIGTAAAEDSTCSSCAQRTSVEVMRAKLCSPKIKSLLLMVGCFEVGRDEVSFQKSGSKVCDRVCSSLSCVRRLRH